MTEDEDAFGAQLVPGVPNTLRPVILPGHGENNLPAHKTSLYQSEHLGDPALPTPMLKDAFSSGWLQM